MYVTSKTGSTQIKELEIDKPCAGILVFTDAANMDNVTVKTRLLGSPLKENTLIQENYYAPIKELVGMSTGALIQNLTAAEAIEGFKTLCYIPVTRSGRTFPFNSKLKLSLTLTGLNSEKFYTVHTVERFDELPTANFGDLFRLTSENVVAGQTEINLDTTNFNQIIIGKDAIKEIELTIPNRSRNLRLERVVLLLEHYMHNDIAYINDATPVRAYGDYLIINVSGAVNARIEVQDDDGYKFFLL